MTILYWLVEISVSRQDGVQLCLFRGEGKQTPCLWIDDAQVEEDSSQKLSMHRRLATFIHAGTVQCQSLGFDSRR